MGYKIVVGLRDMGFLGYTQYLIEKRVGVKLPYSSKLRWQTGTKSEIDFWDHFFKTKGAHLPDDYFSRLNPNLPLQEELVLLLPKNKETVEILDVGAGPLTWVGKRHNRLKINVTAVDPLANEYNALIKKYQVTPPVQTRKCDAENLHNLFAENSFDLVFARNSIDHSYSPENALLEMLRVVKKNCHVFMMHRPNEAITQNYGGMHQWNFSTEKGHFILSSKDGSVDLSKKYKGTYKIACEIVPDRGGDGEWLYTVATKL